MRRHAFALIVLLLLAGCSVGRGCRPDNPPPPTVTATIAPPPTIAATMTPEPSKTPLETRTPIVPTSTPQSATMTPTAELTPTATIEPTETATATPVATEPVKGIHTVIRDDTLWGIACTWYADMPLLPGANPLTPCTCWPGIYWRNGALHTPQLIYPGERYLVPLVCKQ